VREPGAIVRAVRNDHVTQKIIRGASQSKLALRVGVSSNLDPVDVAQNTKAEIKSRRRRRGALWHLRDGARLNAARGLPSVQILV
jgi:hypothetical protein